ncbi:hypothetical protein ACFIJ5_07720 [Haloimpatiens sp. FM7330]|uniref:hypothetical protein n=1 Tax=Haloimpatiens sp. FM7330 TaxID=3298610 RepID=UPI003628E4A1
MKLGDCLKKEIQNQGRTVKWVADQLNINYKTFCGKLERNSISGEEFLMLIDILSLDINHIKNNVLKEVNNKMSVQEEEILDRQYKGNIEKEDFSKFPKRKIQGNTNKVKMRIKGTKRMIVGEKL